MKVEIKGNTCYVIREPGDPKFYGLRNGAGESRLLHHVKRVLNGRGFDLIKKRMWKDGHMMDDLQQYLRTRSPKSPGPHIMIYNSGWAIEGAEGNYNLTGETELSVVRNIWDNGDARR